MKKLIIALFSILTFISCELIFDIEGFAFSYSDLLEYKKNDKIKYTNGKDTLTFTVLYSEKINDSFNNGTGHMEYWTDKQKDYIISERTNEDDNYVSYLNISLTNKVYYSTNILNINLEEKKSHEMNGSIVTYHENYTFNNSDYNDVFEINKNHTKINYILRAIPGGILKFHDAEYDETWELIK